MVVIASLQHELADIKYDLNQFKSQLNSLVVRSNSDSASCANLASGKNVHDLNCDGLMPHFKYCFSDKVTMQVLRSSTYHFISMRANRCSTHNSGTEMCTDYCIGEEAGVVVSALLFGKKASMGKACLQDGAGAEYSKFRKLLVNSIIRNVQLNRFNQFVVPNAGSDVASQPGGSSSDGPCPTRNNASLNASSECIPPPLWSLPAVLNSSHVENVRCRLEMKKGDRSDAKRKGDRPSPDDVSHRCVERLYKRYTSLLHTGRERAKSYFFEELGYALCTWSTHSFIPVNISQASVTWMDPDASPHVNQLKHIPLVEVRNGAQLDVGSENLIRDFFQKSTYLALIVEHDVTVERQVEKHVDTATNGCSEVRRLKRVVHLMDVALKFVNAYCGGSLDASVCEMVVVNPASLRSAYAIACLYKQLIAQHIDAMEENARGMADNARPPTPFFAGIKLEDLFPTPTNQKKTFDKMVLEMKETDYRSYHISEDEADGSIEDEDADQGGGNFNEQVGEEQFVYC